jgi:hypothetical protein
VQGGDEVVAAVEVGEGDGMFMGGVCAGRPNRYVSMLPIHVGDFVSWSVGIGFRASPRVFYFFLLKTCSFITPKKVLAKKEGHLQEFLIIHS